jgi:hypothetical protein
VVLLLIPNLFESQVLRRCEPGRETHDFAGRENIFHSTYGIIFMGTPHRGGNYNSLGKALETLVRKVGFDTNNSILRQLDENNEMLNMIQEEFMRVLKNRAPSLTIYSFQEAKGLAGVQGLNSKA